MPKRIPLKLTVLKYNGPAVYFGPEGEMEGSAWESDCATCGKPFEQVHKLAEDGRAQVDLGALYRRCQPCRPKRKDSPLPVDFA